MAFEPFDSSVARCRSLLGSESEGTLYRAEEPGCMHAHGEIFCTVKIPRQVSLCFGARSEESSANRCTFLALDTVGVESLSAFF